jgi:hypothetical protein
MNYSIFLSAGKCLMSAPNYWQKYANILILIQGQRLLLDGVES